MASGFLGSRINHTTFPQSIPSFVNDPANFRISNVPQLIPFILVLLWGNTIDLVILATYKIRKEWQFVLPYFFDIVAQIDFSRTIIFVSLLATLSVVLQTGRCLIGFQASSTNNGNFIAKPLLFPSRTAHTRFFPKKNSFSYPYIVVGIPVGWKGTVGGMLSVDLPRGSRTFLQRLCSLRPWSSWYTVDADDYLARGHVEGGLKQKLHDYLLSQDENPKDYPHAYLITPPRLFGYYSNPVSIWNLYSSEKKLVAMILEVNNTFNERHPYFLKADPKASLDSSNESPRFTQKWPKDFHVSPFNSREGSYSISAADPIYPAMSGSGDLNTTITLSSSKSHPKLVARVFSDGPALDPSSMSVMEKLTFLSKWWWVSFMTFPRTVQQAINLLWKKKMLFIIRPEPRKQTTSREADSIEMMIERHFLYYLQAVVEKCEKPLILHYTPAGFSSLAPATMMSPSARLLPDSEHDRQNSCELKVLTPLFYSRFVSYHSTLDALLSEANDSFTISLSQPYLLDSLDFSTSTPSQNSTNQMMNSFSLNLLRSLRVRPDLISNPESVKRKSSRRVLTSIPVSNGTHSNQSDFDNFMLSHNSKQSSFESLAYTFSVAKLFIANQYAFGMVELLDLYLFVVRCIILYLIARWCF